MRPVEFVMKEGDEHLTSHSGLALIGALMNRIELGASVNAVTLSGCREPKISHGDIVKSMIGLLCRGEAGLRCDRGVSGRSLFLLQLGD